MKYYLFLRNDKELAEYKKEFMRVSNDIRQGISPVYSELRSAKTNLYESLPYNLLNGIFLISGTYLMTLLNINPIIAVGITMIINNFFGVVSNWIFINVKHRLRLRLCKRLDIEPNEHNIAVMESMEYQSV